MEELLKVHRLLHRKLTKDWVRVSAVLHLDIDITVQGRDQQTPPGR